MTANLQKGERVYFKDFRFFHQEDTPRAPCPAPQDRAAHLDPAPAGRRLQPGQGPFKSQTPLSSPVLRTHTTAASGPWRRFPGLNDPFPLKALKARLQPFLAKWPFKNAQECARTAFSRRGGTWTPPVLRRAPCRYGLRKRPFAASCAAFPAAVKAAQPDAGPLFTK